MTVLCNSKQRLEQSADLPDTPWRMAIRRTLEQQRKPAQNLQARRIVIVNNLARDAIASITVPTRLSRSNPAFFPSFQNLQRIILLARIT